MKITCVCDSAIVDSSDKLPGKAHLIPDENYFQLLEEIDDAIEKSGPSASDKEAAAIRVRNLIGSISRCIYQCRNCGRIYIDGPPRSWTVYQFDPADTTIPSELLRSKVDT